MKCGSAVFVCIDKTHFGWILVATFQFGYNKRVKYFPVIHLVKASFKI